MVTAAFCNNNNSCFCFSTSCSSSVTLRRQQAAVAPGMRMTMRMPSSCMRLSRCLIWRNGRGSDGKNEKIDKPMSFYEKWRPHSMKIGVGAAASLTLYGLSSFMWDITYNIMTMSPASGMYYGFLSGIGLTSMTAASLYYVRTATKVDGNEILYASRRLLNSNEDLRSLLGGYVYVGEIAAFRHTYGSWAVAGIIPKWKAPKIEMIFNVYSGKNEGIATVKATQNGLYGQISFLGVDVLNKTVSRVLVEGEASGFETHDALKELVKLKTTFDDPDIRGHS